MARGFCNSAQLRQTTNRYYSHYTAGEMLTRLARRTYRIASEADAWTIWSTADQTAQCTLVGSWLLQCKTPFTPATMPKQQATMSNEFFVKFRPFDKFEANWTCSVCFHFVERIVRLVAFDNVASTLLLAWTGLNTKGKTASLREVVTRRQRDQRVGIKEESY